MLKNAWVGILYDRHLSRAVGFSLLCYFEMSKLYLRYKMLSQIALIVKCHFMYFWSLQNIWKVWILAIVYSVEGNCLDSNWKRWKQLFVHNLIKINDAYFFSLIETRWKLLKKCAAASRTPFIKKSFLLVPQNERGPVNLNHSTLPIRMGCWKKKHCSILTC